MSWIGVDLDGTLAIYEGWKGPTHIGEPIPRMLQRMQEWRAKGQEVRIFTARCYPLMYIPASYHSDWIPQNYEQQIAKQSVESIRAWCKENLGQYYPITCIKDYLMWQLWDDRAVQVEQNTGRRMDEPPPFAEEVP
jgi:hypothetical protein